MPAILLDPPSGSPDNRTVVRIAIPVFFSFLLAAFCRAEPSGTPDSALAAALDPIAPALTKWATVCIITKSPDGHHAFTWHDYRDTAARTDFWPASTIKIYAVIAALELLNERGFPFDSTVQFEHQNKDGSWTLDCARGVKEMLSEVFRRSSNEDYTLLLRLTGIDRINTQFLTPERGFPHSALMRGYVLGRPYQYSREEAQRITLRSADGSKTVTLEHTWSGRSYSEERGATIFEAKTGNVTSPRELGECLRRVLFAEEIPEADRYHLNSEQLEFLRHGAAGLTGLQTTSPDSEPDAWLNGVEPVFPNAKFFHKCGLIADYALEVAAVDDTANSGAQFILVPVIHAGEESTPVTGQKLVGQMARAISDWVKAGL